MMHMRHDNVIGISDLMAASGPDGTGGTDLYVVSELMDTDLHKVIRSPQPLSDQHVQYFLYQTLRGLKYVHSANILHRDIKPSNLLVNENCDLRVTDFGLARSVSPESAAAGAAGDAPEFLTEYVVTRWYRAPEVVLSSGAYTKAIDVWSVGCVFAELLARKPLFPGSDHVSQLNCILEVTGSPTADQLGHLPEKARRYLLSMPQRQPKPLHSLFPDASEGALQLLAQMLQFDPARRISVEEALAHPYLATFHNEALEPCAERPFNFALEGQVRRRARAAARSRHAGVALTAPRPCLAPRAAQDPAELLWAALCQYRPELAASAPPVRRRPSRGLAGDCKTSSAQQYARYKPGTAHGAPPPAAPFGAAAGTNKEGTA